MIKNVVFVKHELYFDDVIQRYGKRPYGVGLLVAGYDDQGPHIFQTCPSANYYGMH